MLPFWNVNAVQPRQCGRRRWWGGFEARGLISGEPFGFAGKSLGCHSWHIPWWEYKALHSVRVNKPGRYVQYGLIMEQLCYSSGRQLKWLISWWVAILTWLVRLFKPPLTSQVIPISLLLLLTQLSRCIPAAVWHSCQTAFSRLLSFSFQSHYLHTNHFILLYIWYYFKGMNRSTQTDFASLRLCLPQTSFMLNKDIVFNLNDWIWLNYCKEERP